MLSSLKLCSGRRSSSGQWGYRLGLGSAAWNGKSQHHSGPKEMILVSVKETHGDALLGGVAAPKSSGTWALLLSLTCFLTAQDGCLSSCHHLLSPGSRTEKKRRVCPPVHVDFPSVPHLATWCTQLPGRLGKATFRLSSNRPNLQSMFCVLGRKEGYRLKSNQQNSPRSPELEAQAIRA